MKKGTLVVLAVCLLLVPDWGACEAQGDSLEKQLFQRGNRLFRIARDLGALKDDLIAFYAENASEGQWHQIKMAAIRLSLSHRVSFLTSLSIRGAEIIRLDSKHVWCEGQRTVIAAAVKWTEKDGQAVKEILGRVNNQEASQIIKRGIEQIDAALVVYKECDELLNQLMEQK